MKWGFSDQQQQLSDMPQLYTEVAKIRPQYWRLMAAWNLIAKSKTLSAPNSRDWTTIDRSINDVLLLGADVVMIIGQARPWGNATAAEYGSFCAEVATRYKPGGPGIRTDGVYAPNAGKGVRCYEIWNEQNNQVFWGLNVDPVGYVGYLKAAYTAIKAVSGLSGTDSTVIFGGLQHVPRVGPWFGDGWLTMAETTFVTKCYAAEPALGSYYDVMADHIYPQSDVSTYIGGSTTGPAPSATIDNILQLIDIRATMVAKGDGAKKIWITECGYWTANLSEALQNTYLQALYTLLVGLGYVDVMLIYCSHDVGNDVKEKEQTFGAMRYDYTKRPVWDWLKTLGTGGASMSATATTVDISTTADLYVRIKALLTLGQKLTAATSVGVSASASLVHLTNNIGGATTVGVTTSGNLVVNGMSAVTAVDVASSGVLQVLTMSGSTSVGIQT